MKESSRKDFDLERMLNRFHPLLGKLLAIISNFYVGGNVFIVVCYDRRVVRCSY